MNTKKIVVFGAGKIGRQYLQNIFGNIEIVAVVDNDTTKQGCFILGHKIYSPSEIPGMQYDKIVVAMGDVFPNEAANVTSVLAQLGKMGITCEKIELSYRREAANHPRITYLRRLASELNYNCIEGAVAECGVFRGQFAAWINEYFPDKKLYLFDTFTSFDDNDLEFDRNMHNGFGVSENFEKFKSSVKKFYGTGDADVVTLRCPHREKIIIKEGYVPDTFEGLDEKSFAFVNLDMDVYVPQLAALRFFFDRMSPGGVIMLHDYYSHMYPGVKKAVDDFAKERYFARVPAGDGCTIVLIPQEKR